MHKSKELGDRIRHPSLKTIWQRAIVLQTLYKLNDNASVGQVYEQVIHDRQGLDLSAVHDMLEMLHELGIVSRTDLTHGCTTYGLVVKQPGHHLICCQCGCITDVADDCLASVTETIRQDFDFEPTSSQFAVFGICRACHGELQRDRA